MFILVAFAIAAEFMGRATESLEGKMGQGVAGGVVLGLLNAMPEAIVVVIATLHHSYAVAVGAALGGTILTFTIGLGSIGFAHFLRWRGDVKMKGDYRVDFNFLVLGMVMVAVALAYGKLDYASGIPLIAVYAYYVWYRYAAVRPAHAKGRVVAKGYGLLRIAAYLAIGVLVIVALSEQLVSVVEGIAGAVGAPTLWISLLIIPIASELPEILSGYRLARGSEGGASTAIVSFAGGKLVNITVLLGLIGMLSAYAVPLAGALPELGGVLLAGLGGLVAMRNGRLALVGSCTVIALYFAIIIATYVF